MAENLEHRDILSSSFRDLDRDTTEFGDGIQELRATGINAAKFIVYEVPAHTEASIR